jgi:uncharacterized protein YqjF (DUF2071 family)
MNPLAKTDHRPWPLPERPWVMKQVWRDLLFAHWPLPQELVRRLVPAPLELDTFGAQAWITLAPFHMSVCPRSLPSLSSIRELNCRTYVRFGGKPGVLFLSLDASSRLAVWAARRFYHLPYFYADMRIEKSGETVCYSSRRGEAVWQADYGPISNGQMASRGTIDHWLTERYGLYTVHQGRVYRGDIHHLPWFLQRAEAHIQVNTIAQVAGIRLPGSPSLLSFTREIEVLVWPLAKAAG